MAYGLDAEAQRRFEAHLARSRAAAASAAPGFAGGSGPAVPGRYAAHAAARKGPAPAPPQPAAPKPQASAEPVEAEAMIELEDDLDDADVDDIGGDDPYADEDAGDRGADPVDYELLMSVAQGLGGVKKDRAGIPSGPYVKDADCVGESRALARSRSCPAPRRAPTC
jgi:hypothetical protein